MDVPAPAGPALLGAAAWPSQPPQSARLRGWPRGKLANWGSQSGRFPHLPRGSTCEATSDLPQCFPGPCFPAATAPGWPCPLPCPRGRPTAAALPALPEPRSHLVIPVFQHSQVAGPAPSHPWALLSSCCLEKSVLSTPPARPGAGRLELFLNRASVDSQPVILGTERRQDKPVWHAPNTRAKPSENQDSVDLPSGLSSVKN